MITDKTEPPSTPRILLMIVLLLSACVHHYNFPMDQMRRPPGGLSPDQVPQFVVIGNDDVGYAGGINYLTELFASNKNPDGSTLHYSFYVNTIYISDKPVDDPAALKAAWENAIRHGHEIGVHTHSHPHGRNFSVAQWENEMQLCIDHLIDRSGLAVARNQLLGFRTPFTEYGDNTLTAVAKKHFVYDCSLEEGFQDSEDGRNYVWPYKLDHGGPGNAALHERSEVPLVRKHKGIWEIPHYAFVVPPDDQCEKYGVASGLRSRILQRNKDFEPGTGKITGFDWNLWFEYGMDKPEFVATLKYTLDQHLAGNRCPFTVGTHSDIYADKNPEKPPQTTPEERRAALREFVEYALSKPEVRFINAKELLAWIHSPSPLNTQHSLLVTPAIGNSRSATAVRQVSSVPELSTSSLGAGFRYMSFNPKVPPDPAYFVRVGREMASRFPGAKPEGVWIVSKIKGQGSQLSFPITDHKDPLISGNDQDLNEPALKEFDHLGYRIWLQIEPAYASVEELLDIVLKRYGHHSCVVGVGIDDEWYRSTNPDGGDPISDEMARSWLAVARSHNPKLRLFLKHWLTKQMPPTLREGLLFVDDSQIFDSMEPMVTEFAEWGKHFAPAPVAFQIGYPSDQKWWSQLKDPPKDLGHKILQAVPNTEAIFWVDFSITDIFPK